MYGTRFHQLAPTLWLLLIQVSPVSEIRHTLSHRFAEPTSLQDQANAESPESVATGLISTGAPVLSNELKAWLEQIRVLKVDEDLAGARAHLSALTSSEVYSRLLASEYDVILEGLNAIDECGISLDLLPLQEIVRGERIRQLSVRLGADDPILLDARESLAVTRYTMGNAAGAQELFEEVHAGRERLYPPDDPALLAAKMNLGAVRASIGDISGARELFELVYEVRVQVLPPENLELLTVEYNLANVRKMDGDFVGALELIQRVLELWEKQLPPDNSNVLTAKQLLAETQYALGNTRDAHALFDSIYTARKRLLPTDHPDLQRARQALANSRLTRGDNAGALELFELVLAVRKRRVSPDDPILLMDKKNVALVRRILGDFTGAHELFKFVHAAYGKILPPNHPELLDAKLNLAIAQMELGDSAGARVLFERVLEVMEQQLPPDHPALLRTKMNLALTHLALGDVPEAHRLFELVYAVWKRQLPPDGKMLLTVMLNLAISRTALGDIRGALELQEKVHAAWKQAYPPDHPTLLVAGISLAMTRKSLGDIEGALDLVFEVLAGQFERARALRLDAPRVARAAALVELQRLSACLFLSYPEGLRDDSGLEKELFSALESLRGVSVGSGALMRTAMKRPELRDSIDALKHARGVVGDHRLSPPTVGAARDDAAVDSWRSELIELAEERDACEKRVRVELAAIGFNTASPTAQLVAAELNPGAVLIDFFRYHMYQARSSVTFEKATEVDSLVALVLKANGEVTRVELGPSIELERLVTRWRRLIGKPIGDQSGLANGRGVRPHENSTERLAGNHEDEVALAKRLRERLLGPCLAAVAMEHPSELHLILDDFLHLLPVEALVWKDGRRLGEVIPIYQEVSAQRLAIAPHTYTDDGVLLVLGGADYGAEDVVGAKSPYPLATPPMDRSSRKQIFPPLVNTQPEVEELARLFGDLEGGESVVLTGTEASKSALFEHASSARYFHLATHGWFAPETPESNIDLTEDQIEGLNGTRSNNAGAIQGFAPETLCGLALAGANHGVNSAGRVPGIITAEELGALDLSGCELAVLSACETNVGLRRAGQGIQSLQMALHTAGARTAITSLWRVDDAAARRLMELFYTNLWGDKLGKAAALWQAKMALRDEGFGVKDWAAWILTGDPR